MCLLSVWIKWFCYMQPACITIYWLSHKVSVYSDIAIYVYILPSWPLWNTFISLTSCNKFNCDKQILKSHMKRYIIWIHKTAMQLNVNSHSMMILNLQLENHVFLLRCHSLQYQQSSVPQNVCYVRVDKISIFILKCLKLDLYKSTCPCTLKYAVPGQMVATTF